MKRIIPPNIINITSVKTFPNENEIEVILERNGNKKIYPLFEVCCILLKDDPNHLSTLENSHDLLEIETLAGSQHLVRVAKDQPFPTGFYGSYLDLDNPYRSAFFTNLGVKSRRQLNFIGTIIINCSTYDYSIYIITIRESIF